MLPNPAHAHSICTEMKRRLIFHMSKRHRERFAIHLFIMKQGRASLATLRGSEAATIDFPLKCLNGSRFDSSARQTQLPKQKLNQLPAVFSPAKTETTRRKRLIKISQGGNHGDLSLSSPLIGSQISVSVRVGPKNCCLGVKSCQWPR